MGTNWEYVKILVHNGGISSATHRRNARRGKQQGTKDGGWLAGWKVGAAECGVLG